MEPHVVVSLVLNCFCLTLCVAYLLHYDAPGAEHKFGTWTDTTGLHHLACYLIERDMDFPSSV
jgi:hypothetical protein